MAAMLLRRIGRRRAARSLPERLRFERLLANLSARLIPVSPSSIDTEIEEALRQIVELLGMDRARLTERLAGEPAVQVSWARPGIAGAAPSIDPDQFPYTAECLRQGQIVRFSRVEELPDAAATDRRSYRAAGTRSCLVEPLCFAGSTLGVVVFDSVRGERSWPDDVIRRLPLLGDVLAGVLERKRLEGVQAERLRFETLLSEQTATFSSVTAAEIDGEIRRALRRIADFFRADWGGLAEFSHDTRLARITHSWLAEGAAVRPSTVSLAEIPWVLSRLQRGEVVRFARLDELPADLAAVDRKTYAALGITSEVDVPLKVGGALLGSMTFGTFGVERPWADDLVQRLRLLGEVFANILSRRQSEVEAQQLRRDLGHVGRVSTIGELTTSLAHELNQPLTAILSNAQAAQDLLESTPVNTDELREILADIVEDDRRAGEVIHRLRLLLRKGVVEQGPVDINEIVSEVAQLVSGDAAHRGVPVKLDLAHRLPLVWGDRVQLQQVILNLVVNGLDAIRESAGGAPALVLWTAIEGESVRVAVRDSGTGFDESVVEQLFRAFYTTKTEGLGMGLAIARSIVEAHGGQLTARNNLEGGATFSFALPVRDGGV